MLVYVLKKRNKQLTTRTITTRNIKMHHFLLVCLFGFSKILIKDLWEPTYIFFDQFSLLRSSQNIFSYCFPLWSPRRIDRNFASLFTNIRLVVSFIWTFDSSKLLVNNFNIIIWSFSNHVGKTVKHISESIWISKKLISYLQCASEEKARILRAHIRLMFEEI